MFPSSSNNCEHFPFTNQAVVTENENPNNPSQFLHFPADQTFLADDNELLLSHFFSEQQILGCNSNKNVVAETTEIKMEEPPVKRTKKPTTKEKKKAGINGEKQAVPRKRTGKKDRHSKIYTAQGPRDRRMRLSLQIARKFFDLQDMLGFDKASKTIEWLFSKSKAAIKELTESLPSCTGGAKSLSSTSESEVVSGIKKIDDTAGGHKEAMAVPEPLVGLLSRTAMNRRSSKSITNSVVRVSREKARARAKARTIERMIMRGLDQKSNKCSDEANPNDLEHLGSPSPLITADEKNWPLKVMAEKEDMVHLPGHHHEMDSVRIIEKFLGITTSPTSSSIFDYTHSIGESSGASSLQRHPALNEYESYCEMTNMKISTGNVLQAQNPCEIFNINPDTQEQKCRSIYMSTGEQNPNSDFNKALSNVHGQNPSSIAMTSQSHLLEDQFSCSPLVENEYCSLY